MEECEKGENEGTIKGQMRKRKLRRRSKRREIEETKRRNKWGRKKN